jgi:hypothetical protein
MPFQPNVMYNSSFLDPFVSYEENEVLRIQMLNYINFLLWNFKL